MGECPVWGFVAWIGSVFPLFMIRRVISSIFLVCALFPEPGRGADAVNFSAQIRPILSKACFHCHGADEQSRKAKLRLDVRADALLVRDGGVTPIRPGDLAGSALLQRIQSHDPEEIMPPPKSGPGLKPAEIALLEQWISEGAEYQGHWAFTKPTRPAVPATGVTWPRQPLDHFILEKLTAAGLQPAVEADRATLARRVALDLTGLPPAAAVAQVFLADAAPEAYERYVDALLGTPAYGERWARMWMDLARYADSAGYGSDPLRLNIWPYRDWVIRAFNDNVPYDAFSRAQLAGDLIPNTSPEELVATAFHRNTMTNTEGGTDDEEWRVAAVKDRTHVTLQVWMGLTMGCAQCHSHKFDPISQTEFYSTYALFNQTADHDANDESPTLPIPDPSQQTHRGHLQAELGELQKAAAEGTPALAAEQAAWEQHVQQAVAWEPLAIQSLTAADPPSWENQPDHSVLIKAGAAAQNTYHLTAISNLRGITAVRLEALPDNSLPSHGPGAALNGNAVLTGLTLSAQPTQKVVPHVRYVRVDAPGKGRFLHLAEVEVFSGRTNVARQGKASQVSTDFGGVAQRGIDGNTNGDYKANSVTHTAATDNPWWELDLGKEYPVDQLVMWNRLDGGMDARLVPFTITALSDTHTTVWTQTTTVAPNPSITYDLTASRPHIALQYATSTYAQPGWEVGRAIDGDAKTGWAFSPRCGEPHTAVFELAEPLDFGEAAAAALEISLAQEYGENHTLGKFRLSVTAAPQPVIALSESLRSIFSKIPGTRTAAEARTLRECFLPTSKVQPQLTQAVADKQKQIESIKPVAVPVMQELAADHARTTHLLNKGNFLDPGPVVTPAVPAAFGPWPAAAPQNRLGLADWIFSPENPLTARVAVNRFWAQLFGTGLVETEEDFGTQGTLPSHPQLLDWLACEFTAQHWDVKALLKMIVTSATYRQSSQVTAELLAKDERGRLLSRYPRRRLDAEQVRDQALALAGLLSGKLGGPSVYPPQPDGLWKAAFNGQRTYDTSKGEDRYRRGLYTIWRRSVPYPSMATFDAPSRESCTIRRVPTNTPLQAYVTLNDPVYVEAAQALGRRILREGGATLNTRLTYAYRLVLGREATSTQLGPLEKLYQSAATQYAQMPAEALRLATEPLGPLPAGLPAAEAAAWTLVANTLLNLDAVLMKS